MCGTRQALGLALLLTGCSPARSQTDLDPAAGLSACEDPHLADAKCTIIEVEENRAAPSGRKISLAVVVAPSPSRAPAADPLFLIAGGPGQGAAAIAPWLLPKLASLRAERDIVFVDVRGTGASNPLACDAEDPHDLAKLLSGELDLAKLDACLANYEAANIDLHQYTTEAIVDDLDEVRAALGYAQINMLAVSYGTAVAQVYMRRHGEHLRSAVLDGVLPVDRSATLEFPRHAEAALLRVLADCREQPACAAAFPGLERQLATLLEGLTNDHALERVRHPRTGEPMRTDITRAGVMNMLTGALYTPGLSSLLPLIIDAAHAGDYDPLAATSLHMNRHMDSLSLGLYFTIVCAESIATLDDQMQAEAVEGLRLFDDYGLDQMRQVCARWPHRQDLGETEPVRAQIPTLLFSGRYDPVTPPAFAEHVAKGLATARHIEVASGSHGVWNQGCTMTLIREFLASADPHTLDASCLERLQRPAPFVNASGPSPHTGPPEASP